VHSPVILGNDSERRRETVDKLNQRGRVESAGGGGYRGQMEVDRPLSGKCQLD